MPNGREKPVPVSALAPLSSGTEPGSDVATMTDAMPIIARRPFFSSERRFVASCSAVSFLVKPGVSQTARGGGAERMVRRWVQRQAARVRRDDGRGCKHSGCRRAAGAAGAAGEGRFVQRGGAHSS